MIGVYVPLPTGAVHAQILQAIDAALRHSRRHMVVAFGHGGEGERGRAIEGARFLIDRGCDGLIVMGTGLLEEDLEALARRQPNIVVLDRVYEGIREQCFCADHAQGGIAAAQALLGKGHRRIAVITGPAPSPDDAARTAGFVGELARSGVRRDQVQVLGNVCSVEGGRAGTAALLARGAAFTALFCTHDELAIGALAQLREAGIAVPGRVSVMGYGDTHAAECSAPPLTSVRMPLREVAAAGAHFLLNRCYRESLPVEADFPIAVTWRASVAAPQAG